MTKLNRKVWLYLRRLVKGDSYTIHGVTLSVPTEVDPEIRYLLARQRPYEEPEARFVKSALPAGTHVVELGGSIGVVSTLVRKQIGPGARHIIVEANPALAVIGNKNASAGANPGCTETIHAAIDYSGADEVMFDFGHNAHTGRVGESGIRVPTTTLAKVAADLPKGPAALVCDIEGAEFDLVAADADAIGRFDVIILETHPHAYPDGMDSLKSMLAQLSDLGFDTADSAEDVVLLKRRTA